MTKVLEIFNDRHRTTYSLDNLTTYGLQYCMPPEHYKAILPIFDEEGLWRSLAPAPHAHEALSNLYLAGHEIYTISASRPLTHGWKTEWLTEHFPFIPERNHIYTAHKQLLNIDVLVDDCPDNLKGGIYYAVLMDKPWNRDIPTEDYDRRIVDLNELSALVDKLYCGVGAADNTKFFKRILKGTLA